jgi:RNA polymerase sigma-70 factor (ECF subfamily)
MHDKIIEKLRKQDHKTQEYFYKTNAKAMFLICYRYLNNEEEAAEVLNDGFHKVFTEINKFKNGGIKGLKAWTRKIMINECLQQIRKRKNIQFVEAENLEAGHSENMPHIDLEAGQYYQLIRDLPASYRTVFNLHVIEGYTHKEIAQVLNIRENTSRSHLLRARNILKEKIQKLYNDGIR